MPQDLSFLADAAKKFAVLEEQAIHVGGISIPDDYKDAVAALNLAITVFYRMGKGRLSRLAEANVTDALETGAGLQVACLCSEEFMLRRGTKLSRNVYLKAKRVCEIAQVAYEHGLVPEPRNSNLPY
jgi:hypothetical protein